MTFEQHTIGLIFDNDPSDLNSSAEQKHNWLNSGQFCKVGSPPAKLAKLGGVTDQLKILLKDIEGWNKWRKDNPNVKIVFCRIDLSGADLSEVDLEGAKFKHVQNIPEWIKKGIDNDGFYDQSLLIDAIKNGFKVLSGANLKGANLS